MRKRPFILYRPTECALLLTCIALAAVPRPSFAETAEPTVLVIRSVTSGSETPVQQPAGADTSASPTSKIQHPASNVQHPAPNSLLGRAHLIRHIKRSQPKPGDAAASHAARTIQHLTSSIQHPASNIQHPCPAIADEKPLDALGISIALPVGDLPTDHAGPCWDHINRTAGPLAAARIWPVFVYQWDATAFCHRPLYFEEINLERYGYGCCDCLQAGVSAAHFFATVPALPYCMTVNCPHECVYTLGHYRPGSCPPVRYHWPPCDPVAAAAEGGVLTGMIFLIP